MSRPLQAEELLAHTRWMQALARGLVADPNTADDIVQDAVCAVAAQPPEGVRSLPQWLGGVVRHLAHRTHRTDARRRAREAAVARPERVSTTPSEVIERAEIHARVVSEVLALAEPFRTTVLLRFFDGLDATEIGRRLKVPAPTVRARLARGLALLRARLDECHGGRRETWMGALAPLAGLPLPTIPLGVHADSGGSMAESTAETAQQLQSAASEALQVAAQATPQSTVHATTHSMIQSTYGAVAPAVATTAPVPAASVAVVPILNSVIVGGVLMSQKATVLAALFTGAATLAIGFGVGRSSSELTVEEARERFSLVDAERVDTLTRQLATAQEELAAAQAAHATALSERAELAAQIGALTADLAQARTTPAAPEAAAPEATRQLPVAFGEFAELEGLLAADWPELGHAAREISQLLADLLASVSKGEPMDPELQQRIASENNKLVQLAASVMGKIPTHAAVNGEFSHPLIAANLMSAILNDAEVPLDPRQAAQLARAGADYDQEYALRQAAYSEDTPSLEKIVDELALKYDCVQRMREALNPDQRDQVLHPTLADRMQFDVLSPSVSTMLSAEPRRFPSAQAARDGLRSEALREFHIDPQTPGVDHLFESWFSSHDTLLAPLPNDDLPPHMDSILAAGRASVDLQKRLLNLPGLDPQSRKRILAKRGWALPQVVPPASE